MGLFDFGKKKETKSRLDLPPKFDMSTLSSQPMPNMPNIPDDIPMQLPKAPEIPEVKQDVPVPSFGDMQNASQTPKQSGPNVNFEQLASDLKSISDSMTKDPKNPFESEKSQNSAAKSINIPAGPPSNFGITEGEEDHEKVRSELSLDTPIYVNVNDFAIILEDIAEIKTGIAKTSNSNLRVMNLLKDKEVQFANYDRYLEDIQKKLVYIDKALFEG